MTIPFTESKFYKRHKARKEQGMSKAFERYVWADPENFWYAIDRIHDGYSTLEGDGPEAQMHRRDGDAHYRVTVEELPEPEPAPEDEQPWWLCDYHWEGGVSVDRADDEGHSHGVALTPEGSLRRAYATARQAEMPTEDEAARLIEEVTGVTLPVDKWRWQHWNGYSWEEALSPGVGYREYDGSLTIWTDDASRDALRHTFTALARKAGKPEEQP